MLAHFAPNNICAHSAEKAASRLIGLPVVPEIDDRHFRYERFESDGVEAVEVIRPSDPRYYPTSKNAPALILIPGLGMDCRGYLRQFPLGALAEIHCPQAPNEGIEGEEGLGHFARHVEEYIVRKGLHERPGGFIVAGSSMGGSVGLQLCLRGKLRPRALILIGSFANARHLPLYQRVLAPLSWYLPIDRVKRGIKPWLSYFKRLGHMSGGEAVWLVSGRARRTQEYYGRAIMALTRQDQIQEARRLDVPTLVLHGTDDWVLPHSAGEEMAKAIPGARLVSIKGGGHGFFFTHPDEVNEAMAQFIAETALQ